MNSTRSFERKEFTADTGETVAITRFDDDSVAVRIDGEIEWAGDVEHAGVIVGALIDSGLFQDD